MGLPGAGKTYLAERLKARLNAHGATVGWLNADEVRRHYDDWDFSEEGRIRQSYRMRTLADGIIRPYAIADFVAPLPRMRDIYSADYTVWVDTIKEGRFEDTNRAFITPEKYDLRVTTQDAEYWAELIANELRVS